MVRASFVSSRDTLPDYHPHYTHQVRVSFVSSADSVVGTLDLTSYRKRGEREGVSAATAATQRNARMLRALLARRSCSVAVHGGVRVQRRKPQYKCTRWIKALSNAQIKKILRLRQRAMQLCLMPPGPGFRA